MEIFLPGLIIFVLLGIFIFLVLPRMGPIVLGVISLLALIAAGLHHYHLFNSEYRLSTWQYAMAAYTPWVVLAVAIIFVITAALQLFSDPGSRPAVINTITTPIVAVQDAVSSSLESMPSAASATNSVTAAINRGINAIPGVGSANKRTPPLVGLGYSASEV